MVVGRSKLVFNSSPGQAPKPVPLLWIPVTGQDSDIGVLWVLLPVLYGSADLILWLALVPHARGKGR